MRLPEQLGTVDVIVLAHSHCKSRQRPLESVKDGREVVLVFIVSRGFAQALELGTYV